MDISSYIIFGAIIGAVLTVNILKYLRRYNLKKRMQKAKKSEYKAIEFMQNKGYQILDLQKEGSYTLFIDDKPHKITVRADMIVKKDNRFYVAEVKTGEKVTSPKYTDTRRQLLEYYMVFKPNGLILVDMERQKIRTVEYSILEYDKMIYIKYLTRIFILIAIGFIIGFLTRGG
ncbi:hypothetical protein [Tepidanaerobacter acetatoxydans]|uniref:hypothetical protein n=1 Tax=Tepidanaerobacter acetatoxydans TaxID=499229 RepID=UPI001BD2B452|nr:hypothetical protein [Tepidanaerobacter acetatoxydans]